MITAFDKISSKILYLFESGGRLRDINGLPYTSNNDNTITDINGRKFRVNVGFPPEFIILVKTDNAGTSASNQIMLPIQGTNMVIDWGDGSTSTHTQSATPNITLGGANVVHTYASAGVYQIKISPRLVVGGEGLIRIYFLSRGDRLKLLEIQNWGKTLWQSGISTSGLLDAFQGCSNLDVTAKDVVNLSICTFLRRLFSDCSNLKNLNSSITKWQVGNVTEMLSIFQNNTLFNQDIGNWDVSNVTNLTTSFSGADQFNKSLGNWVLNPNVIMTNMLAVANATIGTNFQEAYSRTLIGWANNIFSRGGVVTGRSLGANNRRYNNINYESGQQFNNAVDARAYLISLGWTISGDALI